MRNVEMKMEGSKLVITVDMSKSSGASKTGKSIIIGSTEGNVQTPDGLATIGLNVYRTRGT